MSAQHFGISQSGTNTLGGGATEATQLQVLAELQKQKEFTESIWVDSTGTFYIRRVVYSENLETYTISYTLADGTVYVPVAPSEPASAGTDRELVVTSYTVNTTGTGYAIGDIVHQINIFNVFDGSLLSTIWYNQTTDTVITPAPTITDLTPEGSIQSIASATGTQADVSYTTGNGTIISLLKGLFGKFGTLGQKNMAGSAPVVLASDQASIPITVASLPLPTGAATEATQVANGVLIGAVVETAPGTDTASSGLNGRLQRIAQRLTSLIALWITPGTAIGTSAVSPTGISDGTNFVRLRGDSNGRLQLSGDIVAPSANQTVVQFTVNESITSGNNSTVTATTGTTGGNWICITNNSGIVISLTVGGSSGGADGSTLCTLIAGDSISMPFKIAASQVLRIKPTSGNLTTSDYIQVRVS